MIFRTGKRLFSLFIRDIFIFRLRVWNVFINGLRVRNLFVFRLGILLHKFTPFPLDTHTGRIESAVRGNLSGAGKREFPTP